MNTFNTPANETSNSPFRGLGGGIRVLFIDRDGTLVIEPSDCQVDSFEKLKFYPKVFEYLGKIARELDFELVMVTNQDGLGTTSWPEENFWPVQSFIVKAFEDQGIKFSNIFIDKTFAKDNAPTRKPNTDLLTQYFDKEKYDLENSFVLGDRITDVMLAKNLGCKAVWLNENRGLGTKEVNENLDEYISIETTDWKKIYEFLKLKQRYIKHERKTKETDITIEVNLDGTGKADVSTGIHFFDHMLEQIARHGSIDLTIKTIGDLHIDEHHTIEDTGIALGEAFAKVLTDKRGMERYGFCLPMDDCLAQVAIDFGGRNWIVWDATFKREKVGEMPTEMFFHFFKSFSDASHSNINIKAEGDNEHHKIEAIFKAFAKAIKMAVKRDADNLMLPSTKGLL